MNEEKKFYSLGIEELFERINNVDETEKIIGFNVDIKWRNGDEDKNFIIAISDKEDGLSNYFEDDEVFFYVNNVNQFIHHTCCKTNWQDFYVTKVNKILTIDCGQ